MIELDEDFDAATRELCPDGNCTGVLDAAGRCKVCGAQGTPPLAASTSEAAPEAAAANTEANASVSPGHEGDADFLATRGEAPFDEDRQLCPDGNCIGVLDEAGRCKVCGRSIT